MVLSSWFHNIGLETGMPKMLKGLTALLKIEQHGQLVYS
jgi:hypothetical protein